MKIKLQTVGEVHILIVAGLDTPENFKVLRAGITQSLKTGKNKIIIELSEPSTVPADVLRELGRFKLLANELAGDIVLAGVTSEIKVKIETFSQPPFTICYENRDKALQHFKGPQPTAAQTATPAASPAPTSAPDAAKLAQQKVQAQEGGELGKVRKELEAVKKENEALTKMLAKKFFDRREPEDVQSYQAKIKDLEERLTEILEKPPEKAKPAAEKS